MKYFEIKDKYRKFIFDKFELIDNNQNLEITYFFDIENLCSFRPKILIPKAIIKNNNINKDFLNDLIFNIGMVELVSYWKCCMPHDVVINAGFLNQEQQEFYKKLYYYGLGEFRYINNIDIKQDEMVNFVVNGTKKEYEVLFEGKGNLIPIGGGKDSIVTLNLLSGDDNMGFAINPKNVHFSCAKTALLEDFISVQRYLDPKLLELNKEGFLNGHTPFSALVSFVSFLVAYLANRKFIVLSNESSANEANVEGTKINHQYTKSIEYENDFRNYYQSYFNVGIEYFSMLRPLNELQITKLFSEHKNFHNIFKSCNVGSKGENWHWCCNCPKCLFVYIMLSNYLTDKELIDIFGENLLDKKELLPTFIELVGYSDHKPFECVGTYEEIRHSVSKKIKSSKNLDFLLKYYTEHFDLEFHDELLDSFDTINNLPNHFEDLLKRSLND